MGLRPWRNAEVEGKVRIQSVDVTPEYEAALTRLKKLASAGSLPINKRGGAESVYGEAYQEMVRMGTRPQIRKKYRR